MKFSYVFLLLYKKALVLKILIVSQYYWPENFRITDLANELTAKGHEVTVLTGMPNYPTGVLYDGYSSWWRKRREVIQGVSIYRVPLFLRRKSKSWQLALNYLSFVFSACCLAPWLLRKKNFDVVFTYGVSPVTVGIPAIIMGRLKKSPIFFWIQDLWPESLVATGAVKSSRILSAVSWMVKKIYLGCDFILVQSKSFIEPAIAVGAERRKIKYFPNWAELLYQPKEVEALADERLDIPDSGFIVMFAGNLGAAQSLDTIIHVAELLKHEDIHWVFLGDGRRRAWLQNEVDSKKLNKVHILGSRPMETMPSYFALADVMLVTLKDDPIISATIPGKVQSYLACGRPIVGALNGAGAEAINNSGAGYSVPSGDVIGLSQAILEMSNMSDIELNKKGLAARKYYEQNFDRDMLIYQLEAWMLKSCS